MFLSPLLTICNMFIKSSLTQWTFITPGEKNYEELRSRKEEALSLREYVLLKVHYVKKDREKRIQALEREKEEAETARQESALKLERTVYTILCIRDHLLDVRVE